MYIQCFFQIAIYTIYTNLHYLHIYTIYTIYVFQIYCCVGMLAILGRLHHVNADMLGWWLCERQLPSGGLNGNIIS